MLIDPEMARRIGEGMTREGKTILILPHTSTHFGGVIPKGNVPQSDARTMVTRAITKQLERQMWVVVKAWGDNYYDIQLGSTFVLDFDFQTGKLSYTGNFSNTNVESYARVFNATGVKLEAGDQCRITYRDHDIRQKPYIKSATRMPSGQRTTTDPVRNISIGVWLQTEGNFRLSQSGRILQTGPATDNVLMSITSTVEEVYGFDRCFGVVVIDGLFVTAFPVANATLDGYVSIQIRAYNLDSNELVWQLEFPNEVTYLPFRHFRSNLFWDEGNRVLSVFDQKIWSILIPSTGIPSISTLAVSNYNARYCASCAGDLAVIYTAGTSTPLQVFKRNGSRQWAPVGSPISSNLRLWSDLSDTVFSSECQSRPFPYNSESNCFYFISNPQSLTEAKLQAISREGTATEYPVGVTTANTVSLTSVITPATDYIHVTGNPYGFPWISESKIFTGSGASNGLRYNFFDYYTWHDVYSPPSPDTSPRNKNFIGCQRFSTGAIEPPYLGWVGDPDNLGYCDPYFQLNFDNNLIYVTNEVVPVETGGSEYIAEQPEPVEITCTRLTGLRGRNFDPPRGNGMGTGLDLVDYIATGMGATLPTIVTYEEAHTENPDYDPFAPSGSIGEFFYMGGWYSAAEQVGYRIDTYFYHRPKLTHNHRTVLRLLNQDGGERAMLDLSSGPFNGMLATSPTSSWPDVVISESLSCPEKVWQVKMGPAPVNSSYNAYTDAVFVLQNHRDNLNDVPLPCFRFITRDLSEIRGEVKGLFPTETTTGPEIIGVIEGFTADGLTDTFTVEHTIYSITKVNLDDGHGDLDEADYSFLGDSVELAFIPDDGVNVHITYKYEGDDVTKPAWVMSASPRLFVNSSAIGTWAMVIVYSTSSIEGNLDRRTDMYVINLNDPDNIEIASQDYDINGNFIPRQTTLDRLASSDSKTAYIDNPDGSEVKWFGL